MYLKIFNKKKKLKKKRAKRANNYINIYIYSIFIKESKITKLNTTFTRNQANKNTNQISSKAKLESYVQHILKN